MTDIIIMKISGKRIKIKDCSGLSSLRGMMFDRMENYDGALIHSNSVWMPFVRYKLALFFLDKKMKVIEKQHAVPLTLNPGTWKVYKNKKAKYVLELRAD